MPLRSVCPSCDPAAGGETGDFPGSGSVCPQFMASITVDQAEAEQLGFNAAELRRRILPSFDLPLFWKAQTSRFGPPLASLELSPPSGYEAETRISMRVTAGDRYKYTRLDPAYCDGKVCRRELEDGTVLEVDEHSPVCAAELAIEVSIEVETADGALRGIVTGDVRHWTQNTADPDPEAILMTSANLTTLTGSLLISPNPEAGDAFGKLWLVARLPSEGIQGSMTPEILFGVERGEAAKVYAPLTGQFPPRQPAAPGMAGIGGRGAGPDAGL